MLHQRREGPAHPLLRARRERRDMTESGGPTGNEGQARRRAPTCRPRTSATLACPPLPARTLYLPKSTSVLVRGCSDGVGAENSAKPVTWYSVFHLHRDARRT